MEITANDHKKIAKKFTISIQGEHTLDLSEIWPDGDAPENPTSEDVVQAIEDSCSNVADLISDWNLDCEVDVYPSEESEE